MASSASTQSRSFGPLGSICDLILPIGIIGCVLVIIVPLPPGLMDVLLSVNITVAIVVLLTTVYVRTPLEFSIFPSLLLATTLFRLVLNVATTRLILTRAGSVGLDAAGGVVRSFGEFVAGDKIVVGLIIFAIVILIQFVVITKGATRISEVAARFALDGMPGRQMAIDADLNVGMIDEREAKRRRDEITSQADFFGAMDGASKFVRGDAIAGIVIILINIVGGLFIGIIEDGKTISEAGSLFTKLTIGDGLASQVPAFLISIAAGLLVTRSSQSTNLPREFITQLFSRYQALAVAGGFLTVLMFTSLPTIPMMAIGGGCIGLALILKRENDQKEADAEAKEQADLVKPKEERIEDLLATNPIEFEIGLGLIKLADPGRSGDLLDRISAVRRGIATDIGILLPKVRIRDSFQLEHSQYRIKISGMSIAVGTVTPGMLLAIESGATTEKVEGVKTTEPAFGTPALWIQPQVAEQARSYGYTVVEPSSVMATHLTEVVREYADQILTRDATKHLLDELRGSSPAVVDELVPNVMTLAEVQQILKMLLREQVPIRQLSFILETLGDYAPRVKDPTLLTEYVRTRLARTICNRYRDKDHCLHVVTLDPALEDRIASGFEHNDRGLFIKMSPMAVEEISRLIAEQVEKIIISNNLPVLLVSPQIRPAVKKMTISYIPKLVVISYNEITKDTKIESEEMIGDISSAFVS